MKPADCGYCGYLGPDFFGNYDLVESPHCPIHGSYGTEDWEAQRLFESAPTQLPGQLDLGVRSERPGP